MIAKAVIFDLDGTLIDNERVYDRAFCAVLKKRRISCEDVVHIPGIGVKENWQKMVKNLGMSEDPGDLARETQEFYLKHLEEVKVRPGVREVMYYLRGRGVKRILATSNTADVASRVVETLGIGHHFDSKTFGDEVQRKKPAPDLFLKAVEKESLNPKQVIVVEDSASGIEAAREGGFVAIALKTDWFTRAQLHRANHTVDNFHQVLDILKKGDVF
ncbi:HAD-IA family hydrolase [Candidatus Saccharibacteria bacterium]|nr:HAD-IA family hydrolase [Candidatus Saccharibacteria bacterium]